MALLTVQALAKEVGMVPTYGAVAASDEFPNDGKTFLHVKNGGASPDTVTITTPATASGIAIADPTVVVTNGTEKMIGPFDPTLFNAADGNVDVAHSYTTTVTCAVIRMPV